MIYECAVVAKTETSDQDLQAIQNMVRDVLKETGGGTGEVLIQDDWGKKNFGQSTAQGVEGGHYLYFTFRGASDTNKELTRRLRINESVIRFLILSLGEDSEQENLVKAYKTPFSKRYHGTVTEEEEDEFDPEGGKGRKRFAKRKSCWFAANNIKADWKDPATFTWLITEFGKIAPARISGVSRKHQRFATQAIKRARQLGIVSYISNQVAQ